MDSLNTVNRFLQASRRRALVAIAMVGTLTGCTQSAPKPILPAEAKLELRMPALENGKNSFTREDKGSYIVEIGSWKAPDGMAGAVLFLHQMKPHASRSLGFIHVASEKIIHESFGEGSVTLGAKWMMRNNIGPIEVQRFTNNDLPCVFVQQGYETFSDEVKENILGTTTVQGWYCRQSLDGGAISEFVLNIYVKGIPVR